MNVIHTVNTLRRGGAERQLATLVTKCHSVQHEVITLYVTKSSYLGPETPGVKINHVSSRSFVQRVRAFTEIFRQHHPDIVYSWGVGTYMISCMAARGLGIKVINGSIRHGTLKRSLGSYLRLLTLHLSRYIVANSMAGLRANLLSGGYVLYNGVDEKFTLERKPREQSKQVVICSLANLVPYKDYPTVFKALSHVKKLGLTFDYRIMGDGPLRLTYEQMIKDLEIDSYVKFMGNIPDPENLLASADIFVHSSKGEGCPNAILEAMYVGLPIITTDTGGTKEVVDDNALLFIYGDVDGLTKALLRLMSSPEERERLGARSLQIARGRFSESRLISDYVRILNAVHTGNTEIVSDLYCRI